MRKRYELVDHLGNVKVTVSDRKLAVDDGTYSGGVKINSTPDGIIDFYEPDVLSAVDHYPGGFPMPNRSFNANSYRYGYNDGSEKDDEITGVVGSHFTTYFREFDTRTLIPWSPDPVFQPWQSPYSYMDGNPILYNDPLGDRIKGTRKQKKAFKQREKAAGTWKGADGSKATYKGKNSPRDLSLISKKNDSRVTEDINHADIQNETLSGQSSIERQDYLYHTPLTKTVRERKAYFGVEGITRRPTTRTTRNEFLSGSINIRAISNLDGYGNDHLNISGGSIQDNNLEILYDEDIRVGQEIVTFSNNINIDFDFTNSKKITSIWSNSNSPLLGPHAGRIIIKIVGTKYVKDRGRRR